jgi:hypothetical protein
MLPALGSSAYAASESCRPVPVDDGIVELSGYIVHGKLPGPPDFTSTAAGDRVSVASFLLLNDCIDVPAGEFNEAVEVRFLQLACPGVKLPEGRPVTLRGSLYGSFTGHHWTPVLLDCE